jgi:regulator of sirC expression with transglutaminase-like and TPR domain
MAASPLDSELEHLVRKPDADINLARVALTLARVEYPELNVGEYLARLDDMANVLASKLLLQAPNEYKLGMLNEFLFDDMGFSGSHDNYYDPRNSYLNEVLDRKTGIPITLSMVYLEVGQRIGLPLHGVSFPGHFLVKLSEPEGEIILDPFSGGVSLGVEEIKQYLMRIYGDGNLPDVPLARFLEPAGKKEILVRMLRNLKGIYMHGEDWPRALVVLNHILLASPDLVIEVRDRGLLYEKMECYRACLEDLQRYLELEPFAEDAGELGEHMKQIQDVVSRFN